MLSLRSACTLLTTMMVLSANAVYGQNYPNKPIRIVTSGIGGGADFAARLIGQGISGSLNQPVIIDNRSPNVLGELVSKSPPDGYTLLVAGGFFTITPLLQKTLYDPVTDFLPVTLATRAPNLLVVNPSVPAKSVKELIALAKAKPDELNYSAGGTGSAGHLAAELFKSMADVKIVRVPYKSGAAEITDLLSGEVHLSFVTASSVTSHIKSGRLRALAVTTALPSALAPGLPTVASALPGFESGAVIGVYAPAKTPAPIINRLNQEVVRFLSQSEVKQKFFDSGVEVVGSSPEQLGVEIRSEATRLGRLIKDTGIKVD